MTSALRSADAARRVGLFVLALSTPVLASNDGDAPAIERPWRTGAEIVDLVESSKTTYRIEAVEPDSEVGASILAELGRPPGDVTGRPFVSSEGLAEWQCGAAAEEVLATAEAAFTEGDMETARQGYRRAVELDADCYVAHSHLGDTFLRTDNETMAVAHYNRALELNPLDHKIWAYRGHAHLRQGEGRFALDDFRQALALRPHYWLVDQLLDNYRGFPAELADARLPIPVRVTRTGKRDVEVVVVGERAPWLTYGLCLAAWQNEGLGPIAEEQELAPRRLRKLRRDRARSRDTADATFELSLERECLGAGLEVYLSERQEARTRGEPFEALAPFEALEKALDRGFYDEALVYGVAAQRFAQAMLLFDQASRDRMLDYVVQLVLLESAEP